MNASLEFVEWRVWFSCKYAKVSLMLVGVGRPRSFRALGLSFPYHSCPSIQRFEPVRRFPLKAFLPRFTAPCPWMY